MKRVIKGDKVVVITGKNRGAIGNVIDILPKKGKIKVQGVAIAIKHVKAKRQSEVSSIKKEEAFINISNVMPFDPATGKPCRVNKINRSV